LGILLEEEIRSISEVQGVKNYGGDSEGVIDKSLESDNGGEYSSIEFKAYFRGKCIEHQLSILGRLEQNGVPERMNRTLTEHAFIIRLQADMSEEFWAEAVIHASYPLNMSSSIVVDLQIPEEI